MLTELHLFLTRSTLPTTVQWQEALNALSLPVTLDPAFSLSAKLGSLPALLRGRRTAFEFHLNPSSRLIKSYPGLKGMFPTRDLVATFRFGADPAECAAALAALAALADLTQSPYFDPREGVCLDSDSALARARSALSSLP